MGRRAASYDSRILASAHPGDLPVEAVNVPELVINLRTAKALGIKVLSSLLARADTSIE